MSGSCQGTRHRPTTILTVLPKVKVMKKSDKAVKALQDATVEKCDSKAQIGDCYCALGVLCLAYEAETGNTLRRFKTGRGDELGQSVTNLYPEVLAHYGLHRHGSRAIEVLNDGGQLSFKAIAAILTMNPENYFYDN